MTCRSDSDEEKIFSLRIHPDILEAMQKWANDDLRSINAQIEFVLRESLAVRVD